MLTLLCGVFLGCTVEEPELPPAAPPTSSEAPPPGASAKVAAPTTETFTPVRGAGTPPAETSGDEKDVSGPWVQGLRLATSTDGLAFSSAGEWIADQAGAPSALVGHDGQLRVYYVAWQDGLNFSAVAARGADGAWTYQKLGFEGEHAQRPNQADPHVVLLPDGRYRLYYTTSDAGQKGFYSAVSDDGFVFSQEAGVRYRSDEAMHAAVVLEACGGWWLFAGPNGRHTAFSADGLTFEARGAMQVQGAEAQRLNVHAATQQGGLARLYAGHGKGQLISLTSSDCSRWTAESGSRWPSGEQLVGNGEHGLTSRPDGGFWMVYSEHLGAVDSSSEPRGKGRRSR